MIEKGATTIWELWNSDSEGPAMNSRNHFAFGTVGEWLQRDLLGIDADASAPGYQKIVIRPDLGPGIDRARGEYESLYGTIVSEWRREGARRTLEITIPPNTSATVRFPRGRTGAPILEGGRAVFASGTFIPGAAGVTAATERGDSVEFTVESGTYRFRLADERASIAGRQSWERPGKRSRQNAWFGTLGNP